MTADNDNVLIKDIETVVTMDQLVIMTAEDVHIVVTNADNNNAGKKSTEFTNTLGAAHSLLGLNSAANPRPESDCVDRADSVPQIDPLSAPCLRATFP